MLLRNTLVKSNEFSVSRRKSNQTTEIGNPSESWTNASTKLLSLSKKKKPKHFITTSDMWASLKNLANNVTGLYDGIESYSECYG